MEWIRENAFQLTTLPTESEQTVSNQTTHEEQQPTRGDLIYERFRQAMYGKRTPVGSCFPLKAKHETITPEKQNKELVDLLKSNNDGYILFHSEEETKSTITFHIGKLIEKVDIVIDPTIHGEEREYLLAQCLKMKIEFREMFLQAIANHLKSISLLHDEGNISQQERHLQVVPIVQLRYC